MHASPFRRQFSRRTSEYRIELAGIERRGSRLSCSLSEATAVDFEHLPRLQAFLDLFGKTLRVSGGFDRFRREQPGDLMMTVTVACRAAETIDDHQRAHHPNDAHHIAEDLFSIPFPQCLVRRAREAEIESAREVLLRAIKFARRK